MINEICFVKVMPRLCILAWRRLAEFKLVINKKVNMSMCKENVKVHYYINIL